MGADCKLFSWFITFFQKQNKNPRVCEFHIDLEVIHVSHMRVHAPLNIKQFTIAITVYLTLKAPRKMHLENDVCCK